MTRWLGSCHCGAVRFVYPSTPEWLTSCNCSLCRRLAAYWAYAPRSDIKLSMSPGATIAYCQGDETLDVHSCRSCGCTTHWVDKSGEPDARMAVNFRLCDPHLIVDIPIRHLDGADTWQYLDSDEE